MSEAEAERSSGSQAIVGALLLLLLSIVATAVFAALGPGNWHFASYRPDNSHLLYAPALLPLLVLAVGMAARFGQRAQVILSVAAFLAVVDNAVAGAALVGAQLTFFALDRWLPRARWAQLAFAALVLGYLLFPILAWREAPDFFQANLGAMTLLRESFILRTVSWAVFRRVYERRDFGSVWDYLEYFFCPIFFLVPSLLNLLGYGYFHERKEGRVFAGGSGALFLGLWGLAFLAAYSFLRLHFTGPWLEPFLWARGLHLDGWFLFGGFVSFFMVILHHTGAMAFQVALARFLGYRLRYDMIYPLLARSPMELWRREHNYTRQFLIETFLRPISVFGLRRGWSLGATVFLAALAAYALMTLALSGWRPFEPGKSPSASAGMLTFFAFSLLVPVLFWSWETSRRRRSRLLRILLGEEELAPLRQWRGLDFILLALTLLLVSFGKAAIGAARLWFDQSP